MADYPNSVKNFLTLNDGVDRIVAAHPNDRGGEITAIETLLGALGSIQSNSESLKNLLIDFNKSVHVEYLTAATLTLKAGEIAIPDASGNVRWRRNTSDLTVTWANIDIGAEANDTYYVYAVADTAGTGFTAKVSLSASLPYEGVFYRKIGSFINSAGDITATSIENYDTIGHGTIKQSHLKTASGEVTSTDVTWAEKTLPGGRYSFYPQSKSNLSNTNGIGVKMAQQSVGISVNSTYTTRIYLWTQGSGSHTVSVQNLYITASGKDQWIFILIDKTTKKIKGCWLAPDHPSYGNGGDPEKVPHPFGSYDKNEHEIVLVDNETIAELKSQITEERTYLTIVNEDYKVDMTAVQPYVPLHSGKFLGEAPVMIETIPNYIKVRKLIKLTQQEKDERKAKHEKEQQEYEKAQAQKLVNKANGIIKLRELGLKDEEIEVLFK